MQQPIGKGGLGVLNPRIQHKAFQPRWAVPLITANPPIDINKRTSSLTIARAWLSYNISFIFIKSKIPMTEVSKILNHSFFLPPALLMMSSTLKSKILDMVSRYFPL